MRRSQVAHPGTPGTPGSPGATDTPGTPDTRGTRPGSDATRTVPRAPFNPHIAAPRAAAAVMLRLAAAAAVVLGTSCMVGPEYATPSASLPQAWSAMDAPVVSPGSDAQAAEAAAQIVCWWTAFNDPTLDALVREALDQNLALQTAGLRVLEARARRGVVVGEFFPQTQEITGSLANNRFSDNLPGVPDYSYADASLAFQASWELDFWGKFRRAIQSSDAALQATIAERNAVIVSLVAEVAISYVLIRSLDERIAYASSNAALQRDTLDLVHLRFKAGAVSELDVATARSTLAQTQALVPQFEAARRDAVLDLCVLLGRPPSGLNDLLGEPRPVPSPPPAIAVGIPADLLRRRPDVRAAERIAAARSARIGVAEADFYPAVSISGLTGFASSDSLVGPNNTPASLDDLFDAQSFQGFIGLDVNWPILNYGRILNAVRTQDALYEQAVAEYRDTVLRAAAEVERGLSTFLRNRERAAFLAESVDASKRSVDLSVLQYRNGATDFIRVNQAQSSLVVQQDAFAASQADRAIGAINAFRALGGGWEPMLGSPLVPAETAERMQETVDWGDALGPKYDGGKDFLLFPRPADSGDEPPGG